MAAPQAARPAIGRARIGRRQVLPTIAQTVGIATAAALAGLLVGKLIS